MVSPYRVRSAVENLPMLSQGLSSYDLSRIPGEAQTWVREHGGWNSANQRGSQNAGGTGTMNFREAQDRGFRPGEVNRQRNLGGATELQPLLAAQ